MTRPKRRSSRLIAAACLALSVGCGDGRSDPDRPTGRHGHQLLTAAPYTGLVVEVDHVAGAAPSPAALALLEQRIRERCNKPSGVRVVVDDVIPGGRGSYSLADVKQLEAAYRDYETLGNQAAIYVLYLDGRYATDTDTQKTLGWAYAANSICVFVHSATSLSDPTAPTDDVQSAILVHELGHLFGLVNSGTDMVENHEDLYHPGHDTNDDCVMHYEVESSRVKNLLGQRRSPPTQFGAACVKDLRAAGGR